MARSIQVIYNDLMPRVKEALGIEQTTVVSAVSVEGVIVYAFAFASNLLEQLWDLFKSDVNTLVGAKNPHTLLWYATAGEEFQLGYPLVESTLQYDNTGVSPEDVEASRIITYISVTEGNDALRVKVATEGATDLEVLTPSELNSFSAYMARKKDAGVTLSIESNEADKLRLEIDVFVDPLLFASNGTLIAPGEEPVRSVISEYLKNLPFNGVFALDLMVDNVQQINGVVFTQIRSAEWAYGLLDFSSISGFIIPDAGYLRFNEPTDLTINYRFQSPV